MGARTETTVSHAGGCRCGAVRFEAKGEPFHVCYCHCGDCRRASGAPVSVFVGFRTQQTTWKGRDALAHFGTAPVSRAFCSKCGSPVSYEDSRLAHQVHLMLGAMDDPKNFAPSIHGYVKEQLPFLHIDDGLPRTETMTVPRPEGETP